MHGGEECAARMVKTKADALGIGGQAPICGVASLLQSPRYEGGSSIARWLSREAAKPRVGVYKIDEPEERGRQMRGRLA